MKEYYIFQLLDLNGMPMDTYRIEHWHEVNKKSKLIAICTEETAAQKFCSSQSGLLYVEVPK